MKSHVVTPSEPTLCVMMLSDRLADEIVFEANVFYLRQQSKGKQDEYKFVRVEESIDAKKPNNGSIK